MIFADKVLDLRKKNGWSQEELAEKLNVSRQSVSKWESAQSIPDISKIIQLSEIFGVSTDYLIKDDLEPETTTASPILTTEKAEDKIFVSMEDANRFLDIRDRKRGAVANAVSLIICSVIPLLILLALVEEKIFAMSDGFASGIGVVFILISVATAVFSFVRYGLEMKEFEKWEEEELDTAYGVIGYVKERKKAFEKEHNTKLTIGIILCVLAVVPVIIPLIINENSDFLILLGVAGLFPLVALGVNLIVRVSILWDGFKILLQEEDYSRKAKQNNKTLEPIAGIYWLSAVAIFLFTGLYYNAWDRNWVIWPIAGVLFGAIAIIVEMVNKKK